MRWIESHKLISLLITIMIVVIILIGSSIFTNGKGNTFTNVISKVALSVVKPISDFGQSVSENVSGVFSYKDLQKENIILKQENSALQQKVIDSALSTQQLADLNELKRVLNYNSVKSSSDIVSADVISMDGTNWMNIFTINKGTESKIKVNDIVVNGDGLVGKIWATGKGWSKVYSIIDESDKVSFKVLRDLKLIGIVAGTSEGTLSGFMLDADSKVVEGDTLITSGMGVFPAGIIIGKVSKIEYNSDTQLKTIEVAPAINFNTLQKVAVIL